MTRAELRALCEAAMPPGPSSPEYVRLILIAFHSELPSLLDQLDATEAAHAKTRDLAQERIAELEAELAHARNNLAQVRAGAELLLAENDRLKARLDALRALTGQQAEDEALWLLGERTAREAYLQDALRQVHRAIEADS